MVQTIDMNLIDIQILSTAMFSVSEAGFVLSCSGEYLALTGQKLNGVEMIACGLATHYCLHSV